MRGIHDNPAAVRADFGKDERRTEAFSCHPGATNDGGEHAPNHGVAVFLRVKSDSPGNSTPCSGPGLSLEQLAIQKITNQAVEGHPSQTPNMRAVITIARRDRDSEYAFPDIQIVPQLATPKRSAGAQSA
jgi:hypothetical protein